MLKATAHPPGSVHSTLGDRLDRVAHRLETSGIRYDANMGGFFPSRTLDQVVAGRVADCKAPATLAEALLRRVGIPAHVIMLNEYSHPPLSFGVPGNSWGPMHGICKRPPISSSFSPR